MLYHKLKSSFGCDIYGCLYPKKNQSQQKIRSKQRAFRFYRDQTCGHVLHSGLELLCGSSSKHITYRLSKNSLTQLEPVGPIWFKSHRSSMAAGQMDPGKCSSEHASRSQKPNKPFQHTVWVNSYQWHEWATMFGYCIQCYIYPVPSLEKVNSFISLWSYQLWNY